MRGFSFSHALSAGVVNSHLFSRNEAVVIGAVGSVGNIFSLSKPCGKRALVFHRAALSIDQKAAELVKVPKTISRDFETVGIDISELSVIKSLFLKAVKVRLSQSRLRGCQRQQFF